MNETKGKEQDAHSTRTEKEHWGSEKDSKAYDDSNNHDSRRAFTVLWVWRNRDTCYESTSCSVEEKDAFFLITELCPSTLLKCSLLSLSKKQQQEIVWFFHKKCLKKENVFNAFTNSCETSQSETSPLFLFLDWILASSCLVMSIFLCVLFWSESQRREQQTHRTSFACEVANFSFLFQRRQRKKRQMQSCYCGTSLLFFS